MQDAIHPDSATPMYRQTANVLRRRIESGEFRTGQRIPSEVELGRSFKTSRITIRQALFELERDGLVRRVPGKGTFIEEKTGRMERLSGLTGFGENVLALGLQPGYRVLRAEEVQAPQEVTTMLGLSSPAAFVVERVVLANSRVVGKHVSYLPLWVVNEAFCARVLGKGSLYRSIAERGIELSRADEIVEPGHASREEARDLETEEGALVLRIARTTYDSHAQPVEHVFQIYRPDAYSYRVALCADRTR